jgi:hypothetical protein
MIGSASSLGHMTHRADSPPTDALSPEHPRAESSPPSPSSPLTAGVGRLVGLDLTRGLAVFGMYAVHVGPAPGGGVIGFLMGLAQGRSSALFAVLAGFAVALITGRRRMITRRSRPRTCSR